MCTRFVCRHCLTSRCLVGNNYCIRSDSRTIASDLCTSLVCVTQKSNFVAVNVSVNVIVAEEMTTHVVMKIRLVSVFRTY